MQITSLECITLVHLNVFLRTNKKEVTIKMTAAEFINSNKDLILEQITVENFTENIGAGTLLLGLSVTSGNRDKTERQVVAAGLHMAVAPQFDSNPPYINTLTLTKAGYAKVDYFDINQIGDKGNKLLFFARPMAYDDYRANKPWNEWLAK